MTIDLHVFDIQDYEKIIKLWQESEGVGLSSADSRERIQAYLQRNPGSSFTAWDGTQLVGAVLCGQDGRRGYLHHLAVAEAFRGRGIGKMLAQRCLDAVAAQGIDKVHIFVYRHNQKAIKFWEEIGWHQRDDLLLMSIESLRI